MSVAIPESMVAQCPDRAAISRIILVVLCVGVLVVPTVGAFSASQAVASPRSAQGAPQLSLQQGPPSPNATNSNTTRSNTTRPPTTPPPDPVATAKNIEIPYTDDTGSQIRPTMTVDAYKLNQSTVMIVYQHNQTTTRWYTTDNDVVSAAAWAAPDAYGDQIALAIRDAPVFKQEMRPFVESNKSHPRTGTDAYRQQANETMNASTDYLPDVPGPVEAAKDIYRAGVNGLSSAAADLIDGFLWVVLHLPAPGKPTDPTTWFPDTATLTTTSTTPNGSAANGTSGSTNASTTTNSTATQPAPPQNWNVSGWWGTVWTIYGGLASLVVLPVFVAWVYAWSKETNTPRERDQYVRQLASTLGLVLGGVILLPLALHLTTELAIGIVPSGETFMSTPGNVAKVGLGLALGGILLAVESGLVVIAILILFVEWMLVFFIVAAWPLFAVCLGSGNRYLRPYGESALVAFASILVLKLVQAIWLRFLLELPLSWSKPGMTLLTIGATIVGLAIGFIYLPYYIVTNLLPEFVTTVGSGTTGSGGYRQYAPGAGTAQGGERQRSARTTVTSKAGEADAAARTRPRPTCLEAHATDAATDGGPSSQSQSQSGRGRDRSRRVAAIRQRAYRQDDTFDQFPDNGDVTDTVARTRTTADSGSTGRTPDSATGTAVETTESAVGTAESAAGKVATAVGVAADARRTAKSHWHGVKRYWRSALPGHRNRRPTKPVEPLRNKASRQAKSGWQSVKQYGRAGTDRLVDRERRQRQDQRREHVREQQHAGDEPTADASPETETDTDPTTEETATDETATERRRYYTRQDHQKYGDALSERQKSSIRRHAERRYRSRAGERAEEDSETPTDETDETDDAE